MSDDGGYKVSSRRGRGAKLVGLFQSFSGGSRGATAMQRFAGRVQGMRGKHASRVGKMDTTRLHELVDEALNEATAKAEEKFGKKNYEIVRAIESTKQQLKNMLDSVPPEVTESEEFQALLRKLHPRDADRDASNFARGTLLRGAQRREVQLGEVGRWVEKVDTKANGARVEGPEEEAGDDEPLTFHDAVDSVRRKRRRGEEVEPSDVELVGNRALTVMRALREELSPSWKPEERSRWLNAGDKYVYDLALAAVPKELFEQTNAYQGMQRLRTGEQVFTLRAAEGTAEAAKRR